MSSHNTVSPPRRSFLSAARRGLGRLTGADSRMNQGDRDAPPAAPEQPVERAALVNYATWLFTERRLLCAELYPHMGIGADRFVMEARPADHFHFPPGGTMRDIRSPSTRAVQILDMVGVDWRSDDDPDYGVRSLRDNGTRPELPAGWPVLDAVLLAALADLSRLDAAIEEVLPPSCESARDVPGYVALDDAREQALGILIRERALGMPGLKAKAQALLTASVSEDDQSTGDIARSLARDFADAGQGLLKPQADPIFGVLIEARRLVAEHKASIAAVDASPESPSDRSAERAAYAALWQFWRGTVVETVPSTARGCRALAAFAAELLDEWGCSGDQAALPLLRTLAKSPLI